MALARFGSVSSSAIGSSFPALHWGPRKTLPRPGSDGNVILCGIAGRAGVAPRRAGEYLPLPGRALVRVEPRPQQEHDDERARPDGRDVLGRPAVAGRARAGHAPPVFPDAPLNQPAGLEHPQPACEVAVSVPAPLGPPRRVREVAV